jgi:hypothetical protein
MTFAQNFFPTSVSISGDARANALNARIIRNNDGISLILDRPGDFVVRIDDLNGRNVFKANFRNGQPITLPVASFAGAARVVSVASVSGVAFRQIVAPTP